MLQPARRQNRVKMQLHSSSHASLADVNGPYHPDARPVLQRMALERTRLSSSFATSIWKSSLDNLRGGASTDQEHDVLPTLPGCLKKILYGTGGVAFVLLVPEILTSWCGGLIADPATRRIGMIIHIAVIAFAFVSFSLDQWDSYVKAHRKIGLVPGCQRVAVGAFPNTNIGSTSSRPGDRVFYSWSSPWRRPQRRASPCLFRPGECLLCRPRSAFTLPPYRIRHRLPMLWTRHAATHIRLLDVVVRIETPLLVE